MAELRRCKGTWAFCDGYCEKCTTTATTQTVTIYLMPQTADSVEVVRCKEWYENGFADGRADRDAEIVRCKDCKYYIYSNEKCNLIDTRLNFYATDKIWTNDCFCAWGERKE